MQGATDGVDDMVDGVTGGGPVGDAVDEVTDVVDDTVAGVGQALDDTVGRRHRSTRRPHRSSGAARLLIASGRGAAW